MNTEKKYRCIMYNVPRTCLSKMAVDCYTVIWEYEDTVILGWSVVPRYTDLMNHTQGLHTRIVQFDEPLFNAQFAVLCGSHDTASKAYKMAVALAAQDV